MNKVELLSPAGNLEKLKIALDYGADAVYGGVSHFSLRIRSGKEFTMESFKEGIDYAHARGKKVYTTINGFPFNSQINPLKKHIEAIAELGPDAIIVATPGGLKLAHEIAPHIDLHLSTQANVMNVLDAQIYHEMGAKRIITAREISLKDLQEIKKELPDLELEVFVHGSMCFAYSGRCLISTLQSGRVPNRGSCANDCRFPYEMYAANPDTGTLFRLEEDPGIGTYIMNSKDLRAVQHVEKLTQMGIDSFKIEGRTKSAYYVARTTQVYRKAIDDAVAGRPFDMGLMDELEGMASPGFTEGFYRRHPPGEYQNYERGVSTSDKQQFVGAIVDKNENWLTIDVRNRFETGDDLELMTTGGNTPFTLPTIIDRKGQEAGAAPGSGHVVKIPVPEHVNPDHIDNFSLLIRNLPRLQPDESA